MSTEKVLASVFKRVFEVPINPKRFEDQLCMQKAAYFLKQMEMACGEYRFFWFLHGPYSTRLDFDTKMISNDVATELPIEFEENHEKGLDALKKLFEVPPQSHEPQEKVYSKAEWVETLASLDYIQKYLLIPSTKEELLNKFIKCKPDLKNQELNSLALDSLSNFSYAF